MIKDTVLKRKEIIMVALLTTIIFLTHTIYVKDTGIIFILDDEYGYWANAAYFSGLDWSATVSKIPYYSYGYSLLLVPLFKIFNNTTTMYQVAVLLNGIMVSISFLLCYDIAKKVIKNCDKIVLLSISFLISMYSTYINYSHTTWNECLLMFIFWLLTWCYVNLNNKTIIYKFVVIGILSSYIYIVHQRALGILVASIIIIILMKIFNRITTKQFFSMIIPIIIILAIHNIIKDNIQSNLWLNGSGVAINDYSGQLNKIIKLLSIEGLISFGKISIGQLFYLGTATFLVFYFGIFELLQSILNIDINIKKDDIIYLYLLVFLSSVFTITISAISVINPGRIDQIVYGRYNEIIVGPVMLIGFAKLMKMDKLSNKLYVILVFLFLIQTTVTYYIIKNSGLYHININTLQTIALNLMNRRLGVFFPALISVIVFRLIWVTLQKRNANLVIITMILISIIYCSFGIKGAKSIAEQQQDALEIQKMTEIITLYKEDIPIYFLLNNTDIHTGVEWNGLNILDRSVANCYQFVLKDKKIIPVDIDELKLITGDNFVITTSNINTDSIQDKYVLIGSDNGSFLFKTK